MKAYILVVCFILALKPKTSLAVWGDGGAGWANAAYLAKILTENYRRYQQLRMMIIRIAILLMVTLIMTTRMTIAMATTMVRSCHCYRHR